MLILEKSKTTGNLQRPQHLANHNQAKDQVLLSILHRLHHHIRHPLHSNSSQVDIVDEECILQNEQAISVTAIKSYEVAYSVVIWKTFLNMTKQKTTTYLWHILKQSTFI